MSLEREYQKYNTQFPAQEVIDYNLWDTVTYTSGTTVAATLFNAVRATLDLGNMEIPSQLAAPKAFLIRSIGFHVKQQPRSTARAAAGNVTACAMDNVQQLINTGVLTLTIGSKAYAQFPLWMLPAGGGAAGFLGVDGNTVDPGNTIDEGINGVPEVQNSFTLAKPLFIAPQINFSVVVTWPAAITLTGGNTPVTVIMGGDLIRPVQ